MGHQWTEQEVGFMKAALAEVMLALWRLRAACWCAEPAYRPRRCGCRPARPERRARCPWGECAAQYSVTFFRKRPGIQPGLSRRQAVTRRRPPQVRVGAGWRDSIDGLKQDQREPQREWLLRSCLLLPDVPAEQCLDPNRVAELLQGTRHAEFVAIDRLLQRHGGDIAAAGFSG